MFEITVPIWGPMSAFLVFENLLVRYLGQKFSKLSFFNHIWSHLPGVNGFLLEPFMTCNNFCHPLCGVSGSIGVIVSTFTIGQVIENFPLILMYQTFSTLALCFVILGIATILGKSLGRQIPLKKDHEAKN